MKGDKVLTVDDRLDALERRVGQLLIVTGALVLVHVQQLIPYVQAAATIALAGGRTAAGVL